MDPDLDQLAHQVQTAHTSLLAADRQYAAIPTVYQHRHVLRMQRAYYTVLARYWRTTQPYPVYVVAIATQQYTRALSNKARLPHNHTWQEIARHQLQRATITLRRAKAMAEYCAEEPAPTPAPAHTHTHTGKPKRPTKTQAGLPKRTKMRHSITNRLVYTDTGTTR